MFKKALHPTDFTEESERVAEYTGDFTRIGLEEIILLGKVGEDVIQSSNKPVLVIPPKR